MDFEELFALFTPEGLHGIAKDNNGIISEPEKPSTNIVSYLQREEVILSLIREKCPRERNRDIDKEFLKLFNRRSAERLKIQGFGSDEVEKVIGEHIVKAEVQDFIEKKLSHSPEHELAGSIKRIEGCLPDGFLQLDYNLTQYEEQLLRAVNKNPKTAGLKVIYPAGNETLLILNAKVRKQKRRREMSLKGRNDYRRIDDYRCLSEAFFVHRLNSAFLARCRGMDAEEKLTDPVYRSLWELLASRIEKCTHGGAVYLQEEACHPALIRFLEEGGYGMPHRILNVEDSSMECMGREDLAFLAPFVPEISGEIMFCERYTDWQWRLVQNIEQVYLKMFLLMYDEEKQREEMRRFEKEEHQAARVFQTKKNIPDKYVKVMEKSVFNETFGHVEIDEECDLDSFYEIEKEFEALRAACFGKEGYKTAAIRFRKLGRHKAVGLYFPFYRCLAVDIRCPSSFGHEFLHMYDYEHGALSKKYAFLKVREHYSRVLTDQVEKLDDSSSVKKRMMGKSQANLDYYLRPTEIFARCGEMYFTHLHGIKNSLLKPEYGIEYPIQDESLMEDIEEFFSAILPITDPALKLVAGVA